MTAGRVAGLAGLTLAAVAVAGCAAGPGSSTSAGTISPSRVSPPPAAASPPTPTSGPSTPAGALSTTSAGATSSGAASLTEAEVWQQLAEGTPGGPAKGPAGDSSGPARQDARPTGVRIPAIGVDAPLEALRIDADGVLPPPQGWQSAGWHVEGPVPGDIGPAVIAGHVDSRSGPAVFARLAELDAGDRVEVPRSDGRVARFRVVDVSRHPKALFPTEAVYGPTPGRELRLVTCGGAFDRAWGHYLDNVVVFAVAEL